MEVDVGVQDLRTEHIDPARILLRDMGVAQMFADHRPVLGLRQCVIVGVPWPRLGARDAQLLQHRGDLVVDVF